MTDAVINNYWVKTKRTVCILALKCHAYWSNIITVCVWGDGASLIKVSYNFQFVICLQTHPCAGNNFYNEWEICLMHDSEVECTKSNFEFIKLSSKWVYL